MSGLEHVRMDSRRSGWWGCLVMEVIPVGAVGMLLFGRSVLTAAPVLFASSALLLGPAIMGGLRRSGGGMLLVGFT